MPDEKKSIEIVKDKTELTVCSRTPLFRNPDDPPDSAPRLLVPRPLWDDIQARCRLLSCECSGFGAVVVEKGDLVLKKLYRVPQSCTGANTDVDQTSPRTHQVLRDCYAEYGVDPRLWWHSHNSMSAFWSGTDEATKRSLFRDWGVALVINHRGEWKCSLVTSRPVPLDYELPIFTFGQPEPIDYDRLKKELAEDVVEQFYGSYGGYGGYGMHGPIELYGMHGPSETYDMQEYFKKEAQDAGFARDAGDAGDCAAGLSAAERAHFTVCGQCDLRGLDRNGGHRWSQCPYSGEDGDFEDGGVGPGHR